MELDKCNAIIQNTIDFLGLNEILEFQLNNKTTHIDENKESEKIEETPVDYDYSTGWYEELSSTFNKIYVCAENNDYIFAFISACCLQDSIESELNIKLETTDLLSHYKYNDLKKLALHTKEIELNIINEIEKNHGKIRRVSCVEEL